MEKVRTEHKGKAEKAQKKKRVTGKVPTFASSSVDPPRPGWESKVAELEAMNEELRNDNHRLTVENEVSQYVIVSWPRKVYGSCKTCVL